MLLSFVRLGELVLKGMTWDWYGMSMAREYDDGRYPEYGDSMTWVLSNEYGESMEKVWYEYGELVRVWRWPLAVTQNRVQPALLQLVAADTALTEQDGPIWPSHKETQHSRQKKTHKKTQHSRQKKSHKETREQKKHLNLKHKWQHTQDGPRYRRNTDYMKHKAHITSSHSLTMLDRYRLHFEFYSGLRQYPSKPTVR